MNQYNNLPELMLSNGQIECAAYSLWLDKINTSQGQLIFGGVNTDKFLGTLESFSSNLPNVNNFYIVISLSKISVSYNGDSFILQNTAIQITPDTGTSLIELPYNITDPLFAHFGVTYDPVLQMAWIPCAARENMSTIDFTFGSTNIAVSMDELVMDYNTSTCFFGVVPSSDDPFTLGVTFLRSAYVVYDLSHNFVWLAPTNSKPTGDKIVPIGSGGVETLTGVPTSTQPPSKSSTPANSSLSTGAKAGIGVGVSVGVLLLLLFVVGHIMFRQRRTRQHSPHLRPASYAPGQPMRQTSHEAELPRSPLSANSEGSGHTPVGHDALTPQELDSGLHNLQTSWHFVDERAHRI